MEYQNDSPVTVRVVGLVWFFAMAFGALFFFGYSFVEMLESIKELSDKIIFERGIYYLPGVGLVLLALSAVGLYEMITKKIPSDRITKVFTRFSIFSVVIIFLLPLMAENVTEKILFNEGYQLCDAPSSSWPIYKDVYYTVDKQTCIDYNEKQKKKWPSLYPEEDDEPIFKHY